MKNRYQFWTVSIILIMGLFFTIAQMKSTFELYDYNEASTVFNTYYWSLFSSDDTSDDQWKQIIAIDSHPSIPDYVNGWLLEKYSQQMPSIEPILYWHHNKYNKALYPEQLNEGILKRLQRVQLQFMRYISAIIVFLLASSVLIFACRHMHYWVGIIGFVLILFHTSFMDNALLITNNALYAWLSFLIVWISVEIGLNAHQFRVWGYALLLSIVMAIGFSMHVQFYILVLGALIIMISLQKKEEYSKKILILTGITMLVGTGIAICFDPIWQREIMGTLLDRTIVAIEQDAIAHIIFIDQTFPNLLYKLKYIVHHMYFSSMAAYLISLFSVLGIVMALRCWRQRSARFVAITFIFFATITTHFVTLAEPNKVYMYFPILILPALWGIKWCVDFVINGQKTARVYRMTILMISLLVILGSGQLYIYLVQKNHYLPPKVLAKERILGYSLAMSYVKPAKSKKLHQALKMFFEQRGIKRLADYQEKQLYLMDAEEKEKKD